MTTKHVLIWTGLGVLALAGMVFAFLNFWAAADLGYDASVRGREILNHLDWTTISLASGTALFFGLAIRAWRKQQRSADSRSSV